MFRPFTRLLIANRGEIACRIIRTARQMDIETIAIYSDADTQAQYVQMADQAVHIGPAPARESYLNVGAILAAAKASGAEAIHPGYGFLSENADFASAVVNAGLVFVGPPASAIRAMGDKANAKKLMQQAKGPLLPGYEGEDQSDAAFIAAADKTGYPVILKPAAGGGGKGMKVVQNRDQLAELLASARREGKASFGDDRLILERFLARPRHVEVQIFADSLGQVVHLFERDCTLQRRHQKVIEEAPAPGLPEATRATIHAAAITAAQAVGYVGAGTVEFLIEDGTTPYFMEMNTRLQVEHPVTESITGIDLVAWQLRVAMGEPLPLTQERITCTGHAFEARLYAEDPAQGFLPQTGQLQHLAFSPLARNDSGVVTGDSITIHYDPMIAKIITSGQNRADALARLATALDQTEVIGLTTNRDLLRRLARNPVFVALPPDINWLDRSLENILATPKPPCPVPPEVIAATLETQEQASDPWRAAAGWRLNLPAQHTLMLRDEAGTLHTVAPATPYSGRFIRHNNSVTLFVADGESYTYHRHDPLAVAGSSDESEHHLRAPMPGRITAVHVKDGQKVSRGTALIVLEAMKMEHTLRAPADGTIRMVRYGVGDQVSEGNELVEWEPAA